MFEQFFLERRVAAAWPLAHWAGRTVVVAVSGGADSVALLRALERLTAWQPSPARLIVAHVHHGWRTEADEDERFVAELAGKLGLPWESRRLPPPSPVAAGSGRGQGREMLARVARYEQLTEIARQHAARHLAVAHTADDQVETVLHRILRGTSLEGLAGIPATRLLEPDLLLVRPLLDCRRREVEAYLAELGQPFRDDASNRSLVHTRNRLRHRLLPHLRRRYNSCVDEALRRLSELAGEAQRMIEQSVERLEEQCIEQEAADRVVLRTAPLRIASPYAVRTLITRLWSRQRWPRRQLSRLRLEELTAVLLGAPGAAARLQAPGGVDVRVAEGRATLSRPPNGSAPGPATSQGSDAPHAG